MNSLVLRYALFAALSMGVNLGTQSLVFFVISKTWNLWPGILAGTATGLVTKYVLDKRYIFFYKPKSKGDDGLRFVGYSLMGVVTTALFWSSEWAFDRFVPVTHARLIGGALGLVVGYYVKYRLDRRFVFRSV